MLLEGGHLVPYLWLSSKVNIESSVNINTFTYITGDQCGITIKFYVLQVQENSPAQQGGLEPFFDFIIAIGHTRLVSLKQFQCCFFPPYIYCECCSDDGR